MVWFCLWFLSHRILHCCIITFVSLSCCGFWISGLPLKGLSHSNDKTVAVFSSNIFITLKSLHLSIIYCHNVRQICITSILSSKWGQLSQHDFLNKLLLLHWLKWIYSLDKYLFSVIICQALFQMLGIFYWYDRHQKSVNKERSFQSVPCSGNKSRKTKQGDVPAVVFWSMFKNQLWFAALVSVSTHPMPRFELPSHHAFTKFPKNLTTGSETS